MPGPNPLPPLDPENVYHERNALHAEYDANGKLIGYRVVDNGILHIYGAQVENSQPPAEPKEQDNG
jgi:hypothetical protein